MKWLKRGLFGLLALAGVALVAGIAFEQWSRWSIARNHQPTGQLYEVDGHRMHLHCTGAGGPTVVFQSGFGIDGSLSWALVQPKIARSNRVCSYDRAGILWSDRRDDEPTAQLIAGRLHTLLGIASEDPPYILVGHSLGGPLSMVFADLYPQDTIGMVLVDSSHPNQFERFSPELEAVIGDFPPPLLVRIAAATGLLRLATPGFSEGFPDEVQVAFEYFPQSTPGMLSEFASLERLLGGAQEITTFDDLPLVVLTAGRLPEELPPAMTPDLVDEMSRVWNELQAELAALSTNAERRVIDDASHYIQHDNPDAVINAIQDVVSATKISDVDDQ